MHYHFIFPLFLRQLVEKNCSHKAVKKPAFIQKVEAIKVKNFTKKQQHGFGLKMLHWFYIKI